MKNRIRLRKLNRTSSHRDAMFRNMVTSLIEHDRIRTTLPKAKELKRIADKAVTWAKKGAPRRGLCSRLAAARRTPPCALRARVQLTPTPRAPAPLVSPRSRPARLSARRRAPPPHQGDGLRAEHRHGEQAVERDGPPVRVSYARGSRARTDTREPCSRVASRIDTLLAPHALRPTACTHRPHPQ